MKKGLTELVFILDRSGSMCGLESDTIGGFNSMLARQKITEGEALVTTILFDDRIETLCDRADLRETAPMTSREYYTRGSTALLDAVGGAVRRIAREHRCAGKDDVPEKTVFVIITDGLENSSRVYSYNEVKRMIEHEKEKHGWEFVFLGANIDAAAEAGRIGISADRAARYTYDGAGVGVCYDAVGNAVQSIRCCASVAPAWKAQVEDDFAKRGRR